MKKLPWWRFPCNAAPGEGSGPIPDGARYAGSARPVLDRSEGAAFRTGLTRTAIHTGRWEIRRDATGARPEPAATRRCPT